MFETVVIVQSAAAQGQDRAAVIEHAGGLVLAVADGAGGVSGGARAAELALEMVRQFAASADHLLDAAAWCDRLGEIDRAVAADRAAGETDLVLAAVTNDGLAGASVGDSGAWLIDLGREDTLTARRRRKPLLGSGSAVATAFEDDPLDGTLLLASDGLLKYAPRERIIEVARGGDLHAAGQELADLPRLRSGALPDDVAVILCRRR